MRYFRQQHNFQQISCNFHHAHSMPRYFYGEDGPRGHGENFKHGLAEMSIRVQHTSMTASIRVRVYLHDFLILHHVIHINHISFGVTFLFL